MEVCLGKLANFCLLYSSSYRYSTLLWIFYAPSAQTAWECVYFLQYHVAGGCFLRGVHLYMALAMIVLLVLHLMQVVIE